MAAYYRVLINFEVKKRNGRSKRACVRVLYGLDRVRERASRERKEGCAFASFVAAGPVESSFPVTACFTKRTHR